MKIFACSDIHSAYTPWIKALKEAGFDENNKDHIIILCGDAFDRMNESREVYDYINHLISLKKIIYINGNHEDLAIDLLIRGYYKRHDVSNGTVKTIMDIGDCGDLLIGDNRQIAKNEDFIKATDKARKKLFKLFNYTVNYFETPKYIFVHSWIPIILSGSIFNSVSYYDDDWRNGSDMQWDAARWDNPYNHAFNGLNKTGKTIVFGHWHTSYYWSIKEDRYEFDVNGDQNTRAKFDPVIDKELKIIGLDACTAYTNKVNVVVLEDEVGEITYGSETKEE